jgi:hypothetical protein
MEDKALAPFMRPSREMIQRAIQHGRTLTIVGTNENEFLVKSVMAGRKRNQAQNRKRRQFPRRSRLPKCFQSLQNRSSSKH